MPAVPRRLTSRQKQILAVAVVLAIFAIALAIWIGGSDDGTTALPRTLTTAPAGAGPTGTTGTSPSATPSGSTSGAEGSGGLPSLPGLTGGSGVNSTDLTTLGPGSHRVVLTASSDEPLLAVSYVVKGDAKGKVIYNVKSPVTIVRTVSGNRPYAAIGLQVGPNGTTGRCSVSIDGKVVDTKRINAAYAVMQCVG